LEESSAIFKQSGIAGTEAETATESYAVGIGGRGDEEASDIAAEGNRGAAVSG
jgi:hypothetical protein